MAKKTAWFPGDVRPVRIGVYETEDSEPCFQFWSGNEWGHCAGNVAAAVRLRKHRSAFQNNPWRGLAQNPEAA